MDVPPPAPPSRDLEELHGEHDHDVNLSTDDGKLLNKLDRLMENVVIAFAGREAGQEETEATLDALAWIDIVVSNWNRKMHPRLYDRLSRLRQLEVSTLGSGSATGDVAALQRELKQYRHMVEVAQSHVDADKTRIEEDARTIASLKHKLTLSEDLLGVARNNLAVMKTRLAQPDVEHEELDSLRAQVARLEDEARKLSHSNLGLRQRKEAAESKLAALQAVPAANAQHIMDLEARVKELESERESFHEEIRDLENTKAVLEEELEQARKDHDRLVDLEAESESLHAKVEEVEEERDVCKDDYEELSQRSAESETNVSELREEVRRLQNAIDDMEVEGVEGGEQEQIIISELHKRVRELLETNRGLNMEVETLRRQPRSSGGGGGGGGSLGATSPAAVGESEHSIELHRRIHSLEEASKILHETNTELMRQRRADQERLADLEAETKALRYASSGGDVNVAGLREENRRYREQLAELMAEMPQPAARASAVSPARGARSMEEAERAELEDLRRRNRELELEVVRSKKNKQSEADLRSSLAAAEAEVQKAEAARDAKKAALEKFQADRKAALSFANKPPGLTKAQALDWNDQTAAKNLRLLDKEKEMFTELQALLGRLRTKRGTVTRLRKQLEIRRKEAELLAQGGPGTGAAAAATVVVVAVEGEEDGEDDDDEDTGEGEEADPVSPYKLAEEESKRKKLESILTVGRKVLVF